MLPPVFLIRVVGREFRLFVFACVLTSPHRRPPKRQRQGIRARLPKRYRNKQYDLQYHFVRGRDEP